MRPRFGGFELSREPEQCHLVARPANELDADRQMVVRPVQRDRHRGLAAQVVGRGERGKPFLVLEVLRRVGVVAQ